MNYITNLLVYIRDNLKISITGSCAIGLKHKIKLHYNKVNLVVNGSSKQIILCIPEGNPYIIDERFNSNFNNIYQVGTTFTNTLRGGVILESVAASAAVGSSTEIAIVMSLPLVMFFIGAFIM